MVHITSYRIIYQQCNDICVETLEYIQSILLLLEEECVERGGGGAVSFLGYRNTYSRECSIIEAYFDEFLK